MAFQFPIRIYYEDTDAGGVVYHANYLNFFERSRTEYLRSLGFEQDGLLEQGIAFVVRRCEIDYLSPAKFNDQLLATVDINKLKRASIVFTQQLLNNNKKTLCSAEIVVVCVDLSTMRPVAIPSNILEELQRES